MNSKVKKYLDLIFGLSGSFMFLIAAISYIYGGGNVSSFGAIIPVFFLIVCGFGFIGVIVGYIYKRSASSCFMLFAGSIAVMGILTSIGMLLNVSIILLIICVFGNILLILGGALDWRLDEQLKKNMK